MTLNWYFEIDWDGDGNFTERNEASRVIDFYSRRGREDYLTSDGGFNDWSVSYAEITLDNEDRLYDPRYTSSPLYPNVTIGKYARVRVQEDSGTIYGVIAGEVVDIRPVSRSPREIKIILRGLEDKLRTPVTVALQESITADEGIGLILDEVNYPTEFGRDLEVGADTIPYWWIDDQSAKTGCFELAGSELGVFYIDRDGQARFKSRYDRGASVLTYTEDLLIRDPLAVPMPWDDIRNYVTLKLYPRVTGSLQALWTLGDATQIDPGQEITVWGELRYNNEAVPVTDEVTPQSSTDYTLNSQADGAGSDLTSDMSVESFTVFGTTFKLVVKNNGASTGYITLLQVRAKPIYVSGVSIYKSDQSGSADPRKFTMDLLWRQDLASGGPFADFLASVMKTVVPAPEMIIENRFDYQFPVDLTDFITVQLDSEDVDQQVSIGWIEHSWIEPKNGQAVRTKIVTEPAFDLSDYWYFTATFPMQFGI